MSQQLTQSALIDSFNEKMQSVLEYLGRLPISFWRGLVILLAAVWIVKNAATLFWLVFPVPEIEQPAKLALPIQTKTATNTASVSIESLDPLKDVFGDASQVAVAPVATPPPEDTLVEKVTRLNLKLHGVFMSSDDKQSSAIIADGSKQILYSIGEEIEGNRGVKLARVLDKHVVLDNRGSLESLWLFSEEDFKASSRKSGSSSRQTTASRQPANQPQRTSNVPSQNQTRASARPDQIPKNIGDVVRFSVHREGGKMVGYRIRPGRDRELFNQVGLKANDIVTSVNGIEVNDPKQIRSVYKSMKTATEAQLTVLRDGETHSITISLDSGA